ncbi:MAG: glycoside hydrolase family 27 protein [Lachnospiraceae bacterium]|nr:glycoside hydrolase family 27 protein [Lachnospiraceae bacterium]
MIEFREGITRGELAEELHLYIKDKGVKDLDDISGAEVLKDLYDCRVCAFHIAQVYLRGLMDAFFIATGDGGFYMFDRGHRVSRSDFEDVMLRTEELLSGKKTVKGGKKNMKRPVMINDPKYRFDRFDDGITFPGKKTGLLPMMGWNSWNAFGSSNTEELTKAMADKFLELGLDKLGYKYIVLDDGCYKNERVDGLLSNEEVKFPSGFKALSDYIHQKGLKFGMYNDIGTNLCAGAAVGTCGHEKEDAKSYLEWGVDFIKVDNCYYLWDNATFSDEKNARYTYAPQIAAISIEGNGVSKQFDAISDGKIKGNGPKICNDEDQSFVENIGTYDGTGPEHSPVNVRSGELCFDVKLLPGCYDLKVLYRGGQNPGCGSWLQVVVDHKEKTGYYFDDFICDESMTDKGFIWSEPIKIEIFDMGDVLRLMNHRRQENTLCSYAALLEEFYEADKDNDVVMSLCEWGKTQPQNWGYKVGSSWRILNDITFQVGSDGDPGVGEWTSDYSPGVATQYNKAVIMDEFAGLSRGWNDPDMLMVGMNGLDYTMCRTHFTMWCMMNSPLMLGLDLRRVNKGDDLYTIIANEDLIALNQDALGIQAKRILSTKAKKDPDKEYIRDNDRVDILAKPLSDGSCAISFINLSDNKINEEFVADFETIDLYIGNKMKNPDGFMGASSYKIKDLWSKEEKIVNEKRISVCNIPAHGNLTYKVTPI